MSKSKPLEQSINEMQYALAKYQAVLKAFPDAKLQESYDPVRFSSKTVNQKYTKLKFEKLYNTLRVMAYCEVEFEFDGKTETVTVYSAPKYSRLAYIPWRRTAQKPVIKFSRVAFNLKNNNFNDNMMNDCRIAIMNFIRDNPDHKLDPKHLEPRLKKLILFT